MAKRARSDIDLSVAIGPLTLRNPIMPASGCFAHEYEKAMDLKVLGAIVTKSVTPQKRIGNPVPRVAETASGMLNSIGIPSHGLPHYLQQVLPKYANLSVPVVASISAETVEQFATACEMISQAGIAAIEANISCPNLEADGRAFAMSARDTAKVVQAICQRATVPVWAKLTPNVTDIIEIASAAEDAGAGAVVIANTLLGMAIDVRTRRPKLGNIMGGLSGPAIRPVVLRMVFQCARVIRIPVIGCGGVTTANDALEYLLAGASAVQVGTASFLNPAALRGILEGLGEYCSQHGVSALRELVGAVRIDSHVTDRWIRLAQQSG